MFDAMTGKHRVEIPRRILGNEDMVSEGSNRLASSHLANNQDR